MGNNGTGNHKMFMLTVRQRGDICQSGNIMLYGSALGWKTEADFGGNAGGILDTVHRTLLPGTFSLSHLWGWLNISVIWISSSRGNAGTQSRIFPCSLVLAVTFPFWYHWSQLHHVFWDFLQDHRISYSSNTCFVTCGCCGSLPGPDTPWGC